MARAKRVISYFMVLSLLVTSVIVLSPLNVFAAVEPYNLIYGTSLVYSVKVGGVSVPVMNNTTEYDIAFVSASGTNTVEVTHLAGNISTYAISPKRLGISGTVSANKLTFSINDQYLIIQINSSKKLVLCIDPEQTNKPASSGVGIYNITNSPYNADSTGTNLATSAIQNAINDANANGGGIVYIPYGKYSIANLILKSNVNIYMEPGATLYATGDFTKYNWEWHKNSYNRDVAYLIKTEAGSTNMKIYGRGIIDGNKSAFQNSAYALNLLAPIGCSYFTCEGLTTRNSTSWAIMAARSDHLTFTYLKMFNLITGGAENDCLDFNECQDSSVSHSIGISLDDPYSTKTWNEATDAAVSWPGSPEVVNNITFDDCFAWTICYGFKVGQGCMQNQSNITFQYSDVYDCAVALGIHHKWGAGTVQNVTFKNISIERVGWSNDNNRTWLRFEVQNPNGDGKGPIYNVAVQNITVYDKGTTGGVLKGLDNLSAVVGIAFENCKVDGAVQSSLSGLNITNLVNYSTIGYSVAGLPGVPVGYTFIATEGNAVSFGGATRDVAFGRSGYYSFLTGRTSIIYDCNTFGDPYPGYLKMGFYK